jgi:uncharacterized protein (TIGR02271 family)
MATKDSGSGDSTRVSIPVIEEEARFHKRRNTSGHVLITRKIEEHDRVIDEPLISEHYRIERVPINRAIDAPATIRSEGDSTIFPVMEEVAVVERKLILREEVHITRVRTESHQPQRIKLRRDTIEVNKRESQCGGGKTLRSNVMKTIVGLFDGHTEAQRAAQELSSSGLSGTEVEVVPKNGARPMSLDIASDLRRMGVPTEEIRHYSEGVKGGKSLVVVRTTEAEVERAVQSLERSGARDLDQRQGAMSAGATVPETRTEADRTVIPIIEEGVTVGKREVSKGGVRIYTRVTNEPVEQHVGLRQEHVEVERHPVNRAATPEEMRNLKEGSIEMTESAEEPVVSKQARVVEEVTAAKNVSQEDRTIRENVRKTHVDVEPHADDSPRPAGGHPANLTDEEYARTYGKSLASDPRYHNKDWTTVEPEARREWTTQRKGAWEEFKEMVRNAWDSMAGR